MHRNILCHSIRFAIMTYHALLCLIMLSCLCHLPAGSFTWPKTVAGVTAVTLCETGRASGYVAPSPPRAYHRCSSEGGWEDLTVDQCQYESEVTRVLEQYAKVCHRRFTCHSQLHRLILPQCRAPDCQSNCQTAVLKLRQFRLPYICLSLLEETLKAGGPFYLVSMSGEVKDPTQGVNV